MKKVIVYILLFILAFGIVSAANDEISSKGKTNLEIIKNILQGNLNNAPVEKNQIHIYNENESQNGNLIQERKQIRIGNQTLNCSGNCTYNTVQNIIQIKLSNGKNAEIKIMPETAYNTTIEKLKINSCDESNCTIILKEVEKDNSTKLAYEINATKEARFLGLFKINVKVQTEIDVETGEVLSVKKPWWVTI